MRTIRLLILALAACAYTDPDGGPTPAAELAYERGRVALSEGRADQAFEEFDDAVGASPAWGEALRARASAAFLGHDDARFVPAATAALEQDPADHELAFLLVEVGLRTGNPAVVERALVALDADRPGSARTLLSHARLAFERGDLAAAEEHARAAAARSPGLAEAHHLVARGAEERGDLDGARFAYQACLRGDPGHLGARDGLALLMDGDEAALHRDFHTRIGAATARRFRLRPPQDRRDDFEPLVADLPTWLLGHLELGRAQLELSALREANQAFEAGLELDPRHVELHQLMGECLQRQGKPRAAALHLHAALELGGGA